jgi:hypothetical protein
MLVLWIEFGAKEFPSLLVESGGIPILAGTL